MAAWADLDATLRFALAILRHGRGIRRFLLWSLSFIALVLRRDANPRFDREEGVKISRRHVYATIAATSVAVRHDGALALPRTGAVQGAT